jgi:hypothetical protein
MLITRNATSSRRAVVVVLLAAPAVVYAWFLAAHAVDMPVGDDFFAILSFLNKWNHAGRWTAGNLGPFLEQFYSHRIPFPRLLAAALVSAFGHCDMRILMAVNWIGWVLVLASLVWQARSTWERAAGLLPVSLVMMQPQGYTNMLVAAGSFGHVWTILTAFWAFHLARSQYPARNAWAIALASFASLCTANGLLVFPIVALAQAIRRRGWLSLAWLGAGILAWFMYFLHYSVAEQPFPRHVFSPMGLISNAAVMVGAVASFGTLGTRLFGFVGLILVAAAATASCAGFRDEEREGNAQLLQFFLLSIAMTAYARLGWPSEYMVQDRYRPYAVLIVAVLYLQSVRVLRRPRRRILAAVAVPGALCFCAFSYAQLYSNVHYFRTWSEASVMDIELGGRVPMPRFLPKQASEAEAVLRESLRDRIFLPSTLLTPQQLNDLRNLPDNPKVAAGPSFGVLQSDLIDGFYLKPSHDPVGSGRRPDFGIIFSDGSPLVVPVTINRARFAEILPRRALLSGQYGFVLPQNSSEAGTHSIFAVERGEGGKFSVIWRSDVSIP